MYHLFRVIFRVDSENRIGEAQFLLGILRHFDPGSMPIVFVWQKRKKSKKPMSRNGPLVHISRGQNDWRIRISSLGGSKLSGF